MQTVTKQKIFMISDHAMMHSGVAIQSKLLIEGLINTGKYHVIQLGAARYHEDMTPQKISEDFTIIPSNGFGNKEVIRSIIASEQPDVMIIFTDARFFNHVFLMEDEIREVCPIVWWHVWDNYPVPYFNKTIYESVDKINCISKLTYDVCKEIVPEKVEYIPHSLKDIDYHQLDSIEIDNLRKIILQEKSEWFVGTWVNRNIRRKRPADVIKSWAKFLEMQEERSGNKNSLLIMHTDPYDPTGPNLIEVAKSLGVEKNIRFSMEILSKEQINVLYNISDFTLNISFAEGFGLSTLESLYTATPIIVNQTGGLSTQAFNKENNEIYGRLIKPCVTTISGTQDIHYLNEDYVSLEDTANAIFDLFIDENRKKLGEKGKQHVLKNFSLKKMIQNWDISLQKTIKKWKTETQITMEEF